MKIRPLTGQVLVEIIPDENKTSGGIEIPQRSLSPEEVQESHRDPKIPAPWRGTIVEMGKWPTLKCGLTLMPEYGKGAKVIIRHNAGTALQYGATCRLRMVRQRDVLAVLS